MTEDLRISHKLRNFVPLPSDSRTPLTKSQLEAVFGGDIRAWSEMIELASKIDAEGGTNAPKELKTPTTL